MVASVPIIIVMWNLSQPYLCTLVSQALTQWEWLHHFCLRGYLCAKLRYDFLGQRVKTIPIIRNRLQTVLTHLSLFPKLV